MAASRASLVAQPLAGQRHPPVVEVGQGATPTISLNWRANAERDISACSASSATVHRCAGSAWSARSAASIRASRRARNHPGASRAQLDRCSRRIWTSATSSSRSSNACWPGSSRSISRASRSIVARSVLPGAGRSSSLGGSASSRPLGRGRLRSGRRRRRTSCGQAVLLGRRRRRAGDARPRHQQLGRRAAHGAGGVREVMAGVLAHQRDVAARAGAPRRARRRATATPSPRRSRARPSTPPPGNSNPHSPWAVVRENAAPLAPERWSRSVRTSMQKDDVICFRALIKYGSSMSDAVIYATQPETRSAEHVTCREIRRVRRDRRPQGGRRGAARWPGPESCWSRSGDRDQPGRGQDPRRPAAERWPATFPSGQGSDLAGVVEPVGDGVERLQVGRRRDRLHR